MRIKKLEIAGFKSFADRMVLHFNDPITGVVGPNGCGKSNVVDAIRWCMGEQSAKHLRGGKMEDVIFAGSDGRAPAGMCEVSLTFENDGRVPVEYLQFSEITVTRRLFRDGTVEYLMNGTPCRLRDITDFFLGTGVGTKAYSIIEQGKVSQIVSSKPEDRRFLIEEAAGITKYKLKKKAAEKKMESTRQNLLRVSDVVAEIEKQLGSLRRQAQKAERYKQYKAELRDIELWSATHRWLGGFVEARVRREMLDALVVERDAATTALVAKDADIAAARLKAVDEERAIAELQERLYELDNRIKLGEAENEHAAREAADLDERGHAARGEIDGLARLVDEATRERERLVADLSSAETTQAHEAEALAERERLVKRLKDDLASVQKELDGAKAEAAKAQADIARADGQERALARRLDDLDLRLGRSAEDARRTGARREELAVEIAGVEERLGKQRAAHEALDGQREVHEERLAVLRGRIQDGETRLETVRTELHRRKSRHHSLEEIAQKYEGFARGTRAIMQHRAERWGIRGLVADVVQSPAEYEVAVEAALGDRLGSIVVDTPEVGIDGVEYLKKERQGRSSFIPLRARDVLGGKKSGGGDGDGESPDGVRGALLDLVRCDEDYNGVAKALLGDVLVVDDLLTAVDLWRAGERRRLVTLDGEVVDPTGVVSGGSRDAHGASVLAQKRELRELEEIVKGLESSHEAIFADLVSAKNERQEVEQALESLRRDRHEGEKAILTLDKDLARLRDELGRLESRAQTAGRDHAELERQRNEAAVEAEELRLGLRAARERLAAAEELQVERGRAAVALFEQVDVAQGELTEWKVRTAQAQEKRASAKGALARVEAQLKDAESRCARLEKQIADGAERVRALAVESSERKGVLGALVAENARVGEELRLGRSAYDERRVALMALEASLKTARAALDAVGAKVSAVEMELRELELGRVHLEEQVEERWRVRLVDELTTYHLRPPVTDAEDARVRELRDLIDRMGEINLTAIDEYKALEERYNFLVAQKGDLEAALGQLDEAIKTINAASEKRFREVFDLVNARFQELFPRLFRGGVARLALTNEGDVLESGIDIVAQPPGKKNSTIELLSGGEKALTAVSLIFAIFLVKPSPFCLLDEVDAPLDEANVGRFNDLIRAMTDRSQFILITHNKRTMEIADSLYGVTMEQPGVSKLVSVNLSTAARRAA